MTLRITYTKHAEDMWQWSIVAKNGRKIAEGTDNYAARWTARRAVQKLLRSLQTGDFVEVGDGEANDYPFTIERGEEIDD